MNENGYYEGPEHRCEHLIRVIQAREGSPSKEDRELAFAELLEMFRPLIKSIASKIYKAYREALRTTWPAFYHDTISTAVEMILGDYVPKKNGGKAMFAPYLQAKLYYRTLWRAQKTVKLYDREIPYSLHNDAIKNPNVTSSFGYSHSASEFAHSDYLGEVDSAILSQVTDKQKSVFDVVVAHQLAIRLKKLNEVAQSKLTEKEFFVWKSTLFSGMNINEIALSLNQNLAVDENPWTKQRVHNYYHKTRMKVLAAYGEAALAGEV